MNDSLEKISIIVPVYNRENCIEKCIDSICNQTYDNVEIIIVDDGSTDNSGKICDSYGEKDHRIHVLHQENQGVSAARNAGIHKATGKYIQFVDSDDTVVQTMCEKLIKRQKETDAELIICGYNLYKGNSKEEMLATDTVFCSMEDFAQEFNYYMEKFLIHSPWNKLYLKEKIKLFFNTDYSLGEDLLFNLNYIGNCTYIAGCAETLYNYYHVGASGYRKDGAIIATTIYRELRNFVDDKWKGNSSVLKGIYKVYLDDMLYQIRMASKDHVDSSVLRKIEQTEEFQDAIKKSSKMLPKGFALKCINSLHMWGFLHDYFHIKNIIRN